MAESRDVPNVDLLDEVARDFAGDPEVGMGTMFRSPGLRVGGKIFAFLGRDGRLIVKLPEERLSELVEAGTGVAVVMGKRTMREWVSVAEQGDRGVTLALWRGVALEACRFVGSLESG